MPCGCGGQRQLTVTVDGQTASVQAQPPGMPRYRVTGDDGKAQEFTTYRAAMIHRAQHGGKLRAV